jgi:Tol biopolymer transport system component
MRAELKRLKRDTSSGRNVLPSDAAVAVADSGASRASGSTATAAPVQPKSKKGLLAAVAVMILAIAGFAAYKMMNRGPVLNLQNLRMTQVTDSGKAVAVTISPDGRYIVYALQEGENQSLWVRQVKTGSDVQLLPADIARYQHLSMSPDGDYVYFSRSDRTTTNYNYLYVMPVLGGTPRQLLKDIDSAPSWAPDGKKFVFVRGDPLHAQLYILTANADGSGETVLAKLPSIINQPYAPSWSPDGKTVAVPLNALLPNKSSQEKIVLISTADGTVRDFYNSPTPLGAVQWFPDGSGVLFGALDSQSGKRQVSYISYPDAKVTRFTNDLADYDFASLSVTRDGRSVTVVQINAQPNLWLASTSDISNPRQLTTGNQLAGRVEWTADGHMIARSDRASVLSIDSEGKITPIISGGDPVVSIAVCANQVFFSRFKDGQFTAYRADSDGSNIRRLSSGLITSCSPDATWYTYLEGQASLYRADVAGGNPIYLTAVSGAGAPVSRDGQKIAYIYQETSGNIIGDFLGVMSASGGERLLSFPWPSGANGGAWTADGKGLLFAMTRGRAGNIWEQPLTGGSPQQITHFPPGLNIRGFAYSNDGKQLAVVRSTATSNVLILTNFRE